MCNYFASFASRVKTSVSVSASENKCHDTDYARTTSEGDRAEEDVSMDDEGTAQM